MSDIFEPEKRREIMRKVKNQDTDIELLVRRALFRKGYRFRVKTKIFGKPDIVFPGRRVIVFCDGDFWHGKNFENEKKNYKEFWIKKINTNIKRDKLVNQTLTKEGWTVIRLWKTDILRDLNNCVNKIILKLNL